MAETKPCSCSKCFKAGSPCQYRRARNATICSDCKKYCHESSMITRERVVNDKAKAS